MDKQTFFITATNTDVGKTHACEKLLIKYANFGYKVGYFKPIETGVNTKPIDGSSMLELCQILNPNFAVKLEDVVPYQFKLPAAPYVAKKSTKIDIEFIKEKRDYLLEFCDILIIEGAGGLMVPIELNYFMIDLIKDLHTPVKLITSSKLGSINDTLLSINLLENYGLKYDWYINLFQDKDSFEEVTLPFYKKYFGEIKYI